MAKELPKIPWYKKTVLVDQVHPDIHRGTNPGSQSTRTPPRPSGSTGVHPNKRNKKHHEHMKTRSVPLRSTLLLWLALVAPALSAQNRVDIALYRQGSELEVRIRPTEDFDGILSSILFTLRWEQTSNAQPLSVQQKSAPATYIPVFATGERQRSGPYNYQTYAGFGFELVGSTEETWKAGNEYTVARIPIEGDGDFELVNDEWTSVLENNGDYYISLNGEERTGLIYKSMAAGGSDAQWVTLQPNPNNGQFTLAVDLGEAADLRIEVLNGLGQLVSSEDLGKYQGKYQRIMDLRSLGSGAYQVRVVRNGHANVHKVIVQQ
jgi:hypothetical protein